MSFINSKYKKKLVFLLLTVIIAAACFTRIVYINKIYPSPVIDTAEAGETLELDGITYTVAGWKIMELKELEKAEPGLFQAYAERINSLENLEGYSWCYICVDLTVTNQTEQEAALTENLYFFDCEEYSNGGTFSDKNGEEVILPPLGTADVKFFVNIDNSVGFLSRHNAEKARIVLSKYPKQCELKLGKEKKI